MVPSLAISAVPMLSMAEQGIELLGLSWAAAMPAKLAATNTAIAALREDIGKNSC